MEYMERMKDPVLQTLCKRGFGNEVGRLLQGIRDIQGTNTCFFIDLKNVPKYRKTNMKKSCVTISLAKRGNNIPAKWQPPPRTSLHSKS
jgi:hypothetical protein